MPFCAPARGAGWFPARSSGRISRWNGNRQLRPSGWRPLDRFRELKGATRNRWTNRRGDEGGRSFRTMTAMAGIVGIVILADFTNLGTGRLWDPARVLFTARSAWRARPPWVPRRIARANSQSTQHRNGGWRRSSRSARARAPMLPSRSLLCRQYQGPVQRRPDSVSVELDQNGESTCSGVNKSGGQHVDPRDDLVRSRKRGTWLASGHCHVTLEDGPSQSGYFLRTPVTGLPSTSTVNVPPTGGFHHRAFRLARRSSERACRQPAHLERQDGSNRRAAGAKLHTLRVPSMTCGVAAARLGVAGGKRDHSAHQR